MAEESRILTGYVSLPYKWAMGPTTTRFYEEFKNKKIMGSRCGKCNRVLIPARSFCSSCFVETDEWVEVSQEGPGDDLRPVVVLSGEHGTFEEGAYVISNEGCKVAVVYVRRIPNSRCHRLHTFYVFPIKSRDAELMQ